MEILLVASCYGNRDKLRHDGPLGLYADFTYCEISTLAHVSIPLIYITGKVLRSELKFSLPMRRFLYIPVLMFLFFFSIVSNCLSL